MTSRSAILSFSATSSLGDATLLNIQHDGQKLLNVILIGQPRFKEKLEGAELAGVRQHLYGERTLKALTLSDTQAYVEHRLRIAVAAEARPRCLERGPQVQVVVDLAVEHQRVASVRGHHRLVAGR